MGLGAEILSLPVNTQIAFNGSTGEIWIDPSEEECQKLRSQNENLKSQKIAEEAMTQDGHKIPVLANILGLANANNLLNYGADGVGLLRTEFLFFDRLTPPTEEEQLQTIEAISSALKGLPLTIRTLDIGGDKPVSYLNLPKETNPFLGRRGIRYSLAEPEIFKTQLRAILRASVKHNLKLMFPMIASVKEVRAVKQIMQEVQLELKEQGMDFDEKITIGIMIEVPSAVIMADQLAKEVNFFSIGTNDLSQYTMAAERTNPDVASLADAFEPAVLRMIQQTVKAAHSEGISVSVCGQLASEAIAVPILLGLGVDELSVNPPMIPQVKTAITHCLKSECEALASDVLKLDSAQALKDYLNQLAPILVDF